MISADELKKELMRDPKFKKEYLESEDIAFEIGRMIMKARIKKGLSQSDLALKVGTKQSGIARLENGKSSPSLSSLEKIAKALNTKLILPKFASLENDRSASTLEVIISSFTNTLLSKNVPVEEYSTAGNFNLNFNL